jgi:hypothetical protein
MDALEGIGHACGHNLIGIAGMFPLGKESSSLIRTRCCRCARIACRPGKAPDIREDRPSRNTWFVFTFPTIYPLLINHKSAEELGSGKLELLKKGAYEGMDVCLM